MIMQLPNVNQFGISHVGHQSQSCYCQYRLKDIWSRFSQYVVTPLLLSLICKPWIYAFITLSLKQMVKINLIYPISYALIMICYVSLVFHKENKTSYHCDASIVLISDAHTSVLRWGDICLAEMLSQWHLACRVQFQSCRRINLKLLGELPMCAICPRSQYLVCFFVSVVAVRSLLLFNLWRACTMRYFAFTQVRFVESNLDSLRIPTTIRCPMM